MEPRPWHDEYDPGVPGSLAFEDAPLPELLRRAARKHPSSPAIRFMNCGMTYADLDAEVDRLTRSLIALGVTRGDRIALHLPNVPQTIIGYYAVLRAGGVAVMTNPLYTAREIEHQWTDAG